MGHVSPAMMRTYSHIRRKALDEAAAALEPTFKLVFPPDPRGQESPGRRPHAVNPSGPKLLPLRSE
jgi:hypothetical protein